MKEFRIRVVPADAQFESISEAYFKTKKKMMKAYKDMCSEKSVDVWADNMCFDRGLCFLAERIRYNLAWEIVEKRYLPKEKRRKQ